jgi:hypothetical protein
MNLFVEMFRPAFAEALRAGRSKVSSADLLSPGHGKWSTSESLILLYRRITTRFLGGRGKACLPVGRGEGRETT